MNYKDMRLAVEPEMKDLIFNGNTIHVRSWLPTAAKIEFIQFVVSNSMNVEHGTFSPAVIETFETIAYIKYFTDVEFDDEDLANPGQLADEIWHSGLSKAVRSVVDSNEDTKYYEWANIGLMTEDTIHNIEHFNASFAGTMTAMSGSATDLGNQLDSIIEKIKNKEGIEELISIKESLDKSE